MARAACFIVTKLPPSGPPVPASLPSDHMMMLGWLRSASTMRCMRSTTAAVHMGLSPGMFLRRTPWVSRSHSSMTYSPISSQVS